MDLAKPAPNKYILFTFKAERDIDFILYIQKIHINREIGITYFSVFFIALSII